MSDTNIVGDQSSIAHQIQTFNQDLEFSRSFRLVEVMNLPCNAVLVNTESFLIKSSGSCNVRDERSSSDLQSQAHSGQLTLTKISP
jgi:hypothetical protein